MKLRKTPVLAVALAAGVAAAGIAVAQMDHQGPGMSGMQHQGMQHSAPAGDQSAASKAFAAANEKMHRDMAIEYSDEVDVDFVRGMIPHHQGAIDMARVVIEHGEDPEIRELAEEIIKAQESEIAFMRSWLEKRGK